MSEYIIQDTVLTNLGNSIRTLDGTTATLSPIEMKTHLDTFNTEINDIITAQDAKIAELAEILATKTGGYSDNMAIVPEPCTVTIEFKESTSYTAGGILANSISYIGIDETNTVCLISDDNTPSTHTIECLPFLVHIYIGNMLNGCTIDYLEYKDADGNESSIVAYFDTIGENAYGYIYDNCHIIVHYTSM